MGERPPDAHHGSACRARNQLDFSPSTVARATGGWTPMGKEELHQGRAARNGAGNTNARGAKVGPPGVRNEASHRTCVRPPEWRRRLRAGDRSGRSPGAPRQACGEERTPGR